MKRSHAVVLSAYFVRSGLLNPVFSLLLLARGCTIPTLTLVLGIYSLVVLCTEFPSGVFADKFGRKRTFMLSLVFDVCCGVLFLLANNVWLLLAGLLMHGLGMAFASGSLNALIVDDFVAQHGEEKLPRVAAQIEIIINISITSGAFLAGLLPMTAGYSLHLWVRMGIIVALALGCGFFITEHPVELSTAAARGRVQLKGNPRLVRLLVCFGSLGGMMALIFTYWAPRLATLAGGGHTVAGFVSGISFLMMTLGSLLSSRQKLRREGSRWHLYFALQLVMALVLVGLALQNGMWGFALCYCAFYAVLGFSNVHEQTLLNRLADSSNRAAVMSATSLCAQGSAMLYMGFATATAGSLGITGIWLWCGMAGAGVAVTNWLWHRLRPGAAVQQNIA